MVNGVSEPYRIYENAPVALTGTEIDRHYSLYLNAYDKFKGFISWHAIKPFSLYTILFLTLKSVT